MQTIGAQFCVYLVLLVVALTMRVVQTYVEIEHVVKALVEEQLIILLVVKILLIVVELIIIPCHSAAGVEGATV